MNAHLQSLALILSLSACGGGEPVIGNFSKIAKFPLYYLVDGGAAGSGSLFSVPKVSVGETVTSDLVVNGLSSPRGLDQDSAGKIYFAESLAGTEGRVRKIGAGTQTAVDVVNSLNTPTGVAVDTFNQLYIIENGEHRVMKLDGAGKYSVFKDSELASPEVGRFDLNDNLYLVEAGASAVTKTTPSGERQNVTPSDPGVIGVGFDAGGVLHVLTVDRSTNLGAVQRVVDENTVTDVATGLVNPTAFVFDGFNVLYVAEGAPLNQISRQVLGDEERRIIVNTVGEPQDLLFTPF